MMESQKSKVKSQKSNLNIRRNGGQTVLLVLLVITVILTVALSLISRTVTELTMSRKTEESNRAFSAAEAGIEESLRSGIASSGFLGNNSYFNTTITALNNLTEFTLPAVTKKDDVTQVFLADYPDFTNSYVSRGGLNISAYWGDTAKDCSGGNEPAVGVEIIYGNSSPFSLYRTAVDPCARGNGFDTAVSAGGTVAGHLFKYSKSINVSSFSGIKLMRVTPYYQDSQIGIKTDGTTLPGQGSLISATGRVGPTGAPNSQVSSTVTVFQGHPIAPFIFDYGFYSGAAISN